LRANHRLEAGGLTSRMPPRSEPSAPRGALIVHLGQHNRPDPFRVSFREAADMREILIEKEQMYEGAYHARRWIIISFCWCGSTRLLARHSRTRKL
jgi:hypothetical protein